MRCGALGCLTNGIPALTGTAPIACPPLSLDCERRPLIRINELVGSGGGMFFGRPSPPSIIAGPALLIFLVVVFPLAYRAPRQSCRGADPQLPCLSGPRATQRWRAGGRELSRGALSARAISIATATPPRGSASTTGASKFFFASNFASARPAARRSGSWGLHVSSTDRSTMVTLLGQICPADIACSSPRLNSVNRRSRKDAGLPLCRSGSGSAVGQGAPSCRGVRRSAGVVEPGNGRHSSSRRACPGHRGGSAANAVLCVVEARSVGSDRSAQSARRRTPLRPLSHPPAGSAAGPLALLPALHHRLGQRPPMPVDRDPSTWGRTSPTSAVRRKSHLRAERQRHGLLQTRCERSIVSTVDLGRATLGSNGVSTANRSGPFAKSDARAGAAPCGQPPRRRSLLRECWIELRGTYNRRSPAPT